MKLLISILPLSLILLASGCRSANVGTGISEEPDAFASARVVQSTFDQIDTAVREVFRENGFTFVTKRGSAYTFKKMGDKATAVIYGTTWSTDYMTIEPEVTVRDEGAGNYLLTCEVLVVEHVSSSLDSATGTRHKLRRRGSKGYEDILKRVKSVAEKAQ